MIERARMVREWEVYVERIARAAKELMPDAEIYFFGSVMKGEATGGSDVDILIKSSNLPKSNLERAEIKVRIEEMADLPAWGELNGSQLGFLWGSNLFRGWRVSRGRRRSMR